MNEGKRDVRRMWQQNPLSPYILFSALNADIFNLSGIHCTSYIWLAFEITLKHYKVKILRVYARTHGNGLICHRQFASYNMYFLPLLRCANDMSLFVRHSNNFQFSLLIKFSLFVDVPHSLAMIKNDIPSHFMPLPKAIKTHIFWWWQKQNIGI